MQKKSSENVDTQNVNVRKAHGKRRKAKKSRDVFNSLQDDALKTSINPQICSTKRIVFDENGKIKSLCAADNWDLSDCTRRSKKRSGYVTFTNIYAEQKFTPESGVSNLENTDIMSYISEDESESVREIPIKHVKNQHLDVTVYSFTNDYETVVKYWYDTFQKLHLPARITENQEGVNNYCSMVEQASLTIATESRSSSISLHEEQMESCQ
ncbi:unnamed protein product [Schistosoma rodhaini]|uniref:Uncharacterized protein n=1 Tax=Schistosoma rodhaini TaxID=6188 RepID=A0AA85GE10_9TREM|nr:unnamed protein product [Schistosoma rodhaini]